MYFLKILICKVKLFQEVKLYYNHLPWPAPLALWDSFCPQGLPRLLGAPLVLRGRFCLLKTDPSNCRWLSLDSCGLLVLPRSSGAPLALGGSLGPRGLPFPPPPPPQWTPNSSGGGQQQWRRQWQHAKLKCQSYLLEVVAAMAAALWPLFAQKFKTRQDNKLTRQDDKTASEKHGSMSCAVIAAAQLKKWVWFGSGLLRDWPAYSICVCSINLSSKTLRLQQKLATFSKSSSMAKRDQDWSPTSLLGHTRIPGQKSNKCLFFWVSSEKAGNS